MAVTSRSFKWKLQLLTLYYGMIDQRTPFFAKIPALAALLYIVSPVDFIPDFIPFAGYIDDLLIAPLLLNLSIKMLPSQVLATSQVKAKRKNIKLIIPIVASIVLVLLVITMLFFALKRVFWY